MLSGKLVASRGTNSVVPYNKRAYLGDVCNVS
jgi:hypothetical protein